MPRWKALDCDESRVIDLTGIFSYAAAKGVSGAAETTMPPLTGEETRQDPLIAVELDTPMGVDLNGKRGAS